jgi:hypothetical protein
LGELKTAAEFNNLVIKHDGSTLVRLKDIGDGKGGRVFFVDRASLDMDVLTRFLQTEVLLITCAGKCSDVMESEEYFNQG